LWKVLLVACVQDKFIFAIRRLEVSVLITYSIGQFLIRLRYFSQRFTIFCTHVCATGVSMFWTGEPQKYTFGDQNK